MPKVPSIKPYPAEVTRYQQYKKWLGEVFYSDTCAFCFLGTTPNGTTIEHYFPKGRFPEKITDPDNLLLACSGCNSLKGSFFNEEEPNAIFNCRTEDLAELIDFDEKTGELKPKENLNEVDKQRVLFNIKRFRLNSPQMKIDRKGLIDLLREFERLSGKKTSYFLSGKYLLFLILGVSIKKQYKNKILSDRKKKIDAYKAR